MPPENPDESGRRRRLSIWLLLLAGAMGLRTLAIGRWPGINGDEAWYGVNVHEFLSGHEPFWRTGIGNPLNPLHSGVLLALSLVFPPSAALLRAPEVIFGIAAVALAYPMLWRPLGHRAAMLATALLAVSPTAVAYSRLGWDPSGTPLVALLAVGAALHRRPILALLACALAYFVHPTNIFLLPITAALLAPDAMARYRAADRRTQSSLKRLTLMAAVLAVPLIAFVAQRIADNPNTTLPSVEMVADRVTSPSRWLSRIWGFVNLATGVSTAEHIAAPVAGQMALLVNATFTGLFVLSLAAGWVRYRQHHYGIWLLAGMSAAFAGFHVIAMDLALLPTLERYGMFMLVPMCIAFALAIDAVSRRFSAAGTAAGAIAIATLAAVTVAGYFYPLATRGGDAMATYRTGAREPKLAAFEFIAADSANEPVRVTAEDWFLYWTLRYFAGTGGNIQVEPLDGASLPGGVRPEGAMAPGRPTPRRSYVVAFAGSGFAATQSAHPVVFTAFDPIGRPVVQVFLER